MNDQTTSNGTTNGSNKAKAPPSVVLDKAKETFEARKNPAKPAEVVAALTKYLKIDEKLQAAEKALEAAKAERTEATKEVVALRGTGAIDTKSRGQGRIMARADSAWISFAKEDAEHFDV